MKDQTYQKGKLSDSTDFGCLKIRLEDETVGYLSVRDARIALKPEDSLNVGDELSVLQVSPFEEGFKVLLDKDPLAQAVSKNPKGAELTRVITRVTDWGLFVEIENGISGLIPIGRISREMRNSFKVGDTIKVAVDELRLETRTFFLLFKEKL